jgi:hypothetical protein
LNVFNDEARTLNRDESMGICLGQVWWRQDNPVLRAEDANTARSASLLAAAGA